MKPLFTKYCQIANVIVTSITVVFSWAEAATIFSDDFSTFSLGTTWNASGTAPNSNLSSNGNHLNMQSNAGYGDAFAIYTTVGTAVTSYGDLTLTVAFTPVAGWLAPFEMDISGNAGYGARFFTYRFNEWSSDGTGTPPDISGHWDLATDYIATLNITSSGSALSIMNESLTVYTRNYDLTRSNIGNDMTLQFRQLTQGDGSNIGVSIDSISLSGVAVPEPSTSILCAAGIICLLCRHRRK
jgi:hypothetical protein